MENETRIYLPKGRAKEQGHGTKNVDDSALSCTAEWPSSQHRVNTLRLWTTKAPSNQFYPSFSLAEISNLGWGAFRIDWKAVVNLLKWHGLGFDSIPAKIVTLLSGTASLNGGRRRCAKSLSATRGNHPPQNCVAWCPIRRQSSS